MSFSGHAPRKVLSLLKAIVCLGVNNIRDRRLINAVWSGEESDAGKAAFNVTLHRLRKLLQHPDAIAIEDGVVTLNTDVCWIDAIAFERLLGNARSPDRVERALALYRGNLLPEDEEEPWSGYLREKLRRKFLHEAGAIGTALESSEQWQAAIELYQRGLDADNLVEAFYQGLMRCYRALDRGCEGYRPISAYGSCSPSRSVSSRRPKANRCIALCLPAGWNQRALHSPIGGRSPADSRNARLQVPIAP